MFYEDSCYCGIFGNISHVFLSSATLCLVTDEWLMFDDDRVTAVPAEDILKLSGGGKQIFQYDKS